VPDAVGEALHADEGEGAARRGGGLRLLRAHGAPVERRREHAGAKMKVPARHDVLEHGHAAEELGGLKRAREATGGDLARGETGDGRAGDDHLAARGPLETADHVQERGLPRPVRPDDPANLACVDLEAHAVERADAAERDREIAHGQHRRARRRDARARRHHAPITRRRRAGPRRAASRGAAAPPIREPAAAGAR
jgi:hypothetical protein